MRGERKFADARGRASAGFEPNHRHTNRIGWVIYESECRDRNAYINHLRNTLVQVQDAFRPKLVDGSRAKILPLPADVADQRHHDFGYGWARGSSGEVWHGIRYSEDTIGPNARGYARVPVDNLQFYVPLTAGDPRPPGPWLRITKTKDADDRSLLEFYGARATGDKTQGDQEDLSGVDMRGRDPVYQDPVEAEHDRNELQLSATTSTGATIPRTPKISRKIQQTLTGMKSKEKARKSTVPLAGSSTMESFEALGFGLTHVQGPREVTALTTAGMESPTKTRTRLADKLAQAGSSLIPLVLVASKAPSSTTSAVPMASSALPTPTLVSPPAAPSAPPAPPALRPAPARYQMIDAISLDQISTWHLRANDLSLEFGHPTPPPSVQTAERTGEPSRVAIPGRSRPARCRCSGQRG